MALRWCSLLLVFGAWLCRAAEAPTLEAAFAAARKGERTNAIAILNAVIRETPDNVRAWHARAQMRGMGGDEEGAISDFTEAIQREPKSPYLVQERAMLYFRRNDMEKALIDFDRANEIEPRLVPQNWQRGIALYYAGKFAEGRRQFEQHRTVNPDDVENAAWHFLCTARDKGIAEARRNLIPVEGDTRVPMKEVQLLFAGKATPEDVLKAAGTTEAAARGRDNQVFYAHLYLGLYFEAVGEPGKAAEHIRAAAAMAPRDDYMGDVARVHARRLKQ
jgi:lipoprotein NlpI